MSKYYDDNELERALFALELEEPPAELRSSILAGTIYHVPLSATIRPWEPWLYGGLCAALVWLLVLVLGGAGSHATGTLTSYGEQLLAFVSKPATLFWIAVGFAAILISQANLTLIPGYRRAARR